jgi:hypothetical protein
VLFYDKENAILVAPRTVLCCAILWRERFSCKLFAASRLMRFWMLLSDSSVGRSKFHKDLIQPLRSYVLREIEFEDCWFAEGFVCCCAHGGYASISVH